MHLSLYMALVAAERFFFGLTAVGTFYGLWLILADIWRSGRDTKHKDD